MVQYQEDGQQEMVIENILPLAIQAENQTEYSNIGKLSLDEEDLTNNIEKVGIEGNLSPRHIEKLKTNQGIQKKKDKGVKTSLMQTRNSLKNTSK